MNKHRLRLENSSIETKLVRITMMTTGFSLLLVFLFLLTIEFFFYRQNIFNNLTVQAKLISENSTAAVVFRVPKTANEILSALQSSPEIIRAEIFLSEPEINPFAKFEREASSETIDPIKPAWLPAFQPRLQLRQDILFNGVKIGVLLMEADMRGLYWTVARYAGLTLLAAFSALVPAFLLLQRLKTVITTPMSALYQLMRKVSRNKDYSLRSDNDSPDEVGALARSFNEMLEQIQIRDGNLRTELSERKRAQELLDRLAYYDTVTGLANRHCFNERLGYTVAGAKSFGKRAALMFIDLDNFKIVNDTFGHHVGDHLLAAAGERLKGILRSSDIIFRIGGDEFAIILEHVESSEDVVGVAEKIIQGLSSRFLVEGNEVYIGASIGASLFPDDTDEPAVLLKFADTAMYYAKAQGKNTYQLFHAEMKGKAVERLNMENNLRRALEKNEFFLEYQPKLDLDTGKIFGVEALVRWQDPNLGLVSPASFIPVAEETGLIFPLGEWVLRTACAQAAEWQSEFPDQPIISVNLSGRQFHDDKLVEKVQQIVFDTGINPHMLELELTESTLMDGTESNLSKLNKLRAMGIRFSIDDFGIGYSSMSYLKRFPISTIKIDRSFVQGLPGDLEDVSIIKAIIALGLSLNMNLLAEGVETKEQADFLKANGCPNIQGYYFSRPLPARALTDLLLEREVVF